MGLNDFAIIRKEIERRKREIDNKIHEVGKRFVERAKETGSYHDVTGHLRASNKYEVSDRYLRLYNDAEYAADVEARGETVITAAALEAIAELEKEFK